MCDNVPLIGDDADGLAVVVCESHLNHVTTFVICYVSIIHISADLSIAFSIKSKTFAIFFSCKIFIFAVDKMLSGPPPVLSSRRFSRSHQENRVVVQKQFRVAERVVLPKLNS